MKNKILITLTIITMISQTTPAQETKTRIIHDPHSFADPAIASVKHLDLTLNVDFDKKILTGKASWDIDNRLLETIKEVRNTPPFISFDTRGLTITKVTLNVTELVAEWSLDEPVPFLGSRLKVNITPTTTRINIYYTTSAEADAVQWLSPEQTAGKVYPFLFTQSQAILARTWIPCQDSPGIRFTYNADVTVPKHLLALMSAQNPTVKNDQGKYHFIMSKPIPSYLMALAVGDIVFKPIGKRTGVYAEPVTVEKAAYEFFDMENMLLTAEKLYGPYVWDRYDVIVLPPSFPFGGMENPMLTFATPTILAGDRSLTSLVAHELAHSWSGNLVTNATWNDFWMNEGFTVYFERRIMEALYGKDFADMQAVQGREDLVQTIEELGKDSPDTKLKLALENRDPDDGMNDIAYEKGYSLLRLIENTIGREKFDAFLKQYFAEHSFQVITTEEFLVEFNAKIIQGDTSISNKINLNKWIYEPGLPDNSPVIISERFNKVDEKVKLFLSGTSPDSIDVKGFTTDEWIRFLSKLPAGMSESQMKKLDDVFHFTKSGNSEILGIWFERAITAKYTPAYGALEDFLIQVGRRKFLKPLYSEMAKTPDGMQMAKKIYSKARQNYHSVSRNTIDEILKMNEQ